MSSLIDALYGDEPSTIIPDFGSDDVSEPQVVLTCTHNRLITLCEPCKEQQVAALLRQYPGTCPTQISHYLAHFVDGHTHEMALELAGISEAK